MVWTEVSGLLAVVAGLVVIVPLLAIILQETRRPDEPLSPRAISRLPENADLRYGARRDAMRRYSAEHYIRRKS